MSYFDVFNGDADGLCALLQLHQHTPRKSTLVTGVKRDIRLLDRINVREGDAVCVLDISLDSNRDSLMRLLDAGALITYFDHHHSGLIPEHSHLSQHIDTSPGICTSMLVNTRLNGAHQLWAIVGAFGDNLHESAEMLATKLDLSQTEILQLKHLGEALNYNAYGDTVADLRYPPDTLFHHLLESSSPFSFIRESPHYLVLNNGLTDDIDLARRISPIMLHKQGAIYLLPDTEWARRVSGIFANELAVTHRARAHAVLTHNHGGGYTVSVRAPKSNPRGAAQLCRQFPTGGGREAAAGINCLPEERVDSFAKAFGRQFSGTG